MNILQINGKCITFFTLEGSNHWISAGIRKDNCSKHSSSSILPKSSERNSTMLRNVDGLSRLMTRLWVICCRSNRKFLFEWDGFGGNSPDTNFAYLDSGLLDSLFSTYSSKSWFRICFTVLSWLKLSWVIPVRISEMRGSFLKINKSTNTVLHFKSSLY